MEIPIKVREQIKITLRYNGDLLFETLYTGKIPKQKNMVSINGECEISRGIKNNSGLSTQCIKHRVAAYTPIKSKYFSLIL